MFEDLREYAKENKVPIIRDEGLDFLLSSISKHNVKTCLEVGTAIGYSAIRMASLGYTRIGNYCSCRSNSLLLSA